MKCKECGSTHKNHKCDNCGEFYDQNPYGEKLSGTIVVYFRAKGGRHKNGSQGIGKKVGVFHLCHTCTEEREIFITTVNPLREETKNEQQSKS